MKTYPSYLTGQNHPSRRKAAHQVLSILKEEWVEIRDRSDVFETVLDEGNPKDPNAVLVIEPTSQVIVGYLPKKHKWVAEAIREEKSVIVGVAGIKRKGVFRRKYFVDLRLTAV